VALVSIMPTRSPFVLRIVRVGGRGASSALADGGAGGDGNHARCAWMYQVELRAGEGGGREAWETLGEHLGNCSWSRRAWDGVCRGDASERPRSEVGLIGFQSMDQNSLAALLVDWPAVVISDGSYSCLAVWERCTGWGVVSWGNAKLSKILNPIQSWGDAALRAWPVKLR